MTIGQRLVLSLDRNFGLFGRVEARRADLYERLFTLGEWVAGTKRVLDVGIGTGDLTCRLCGHTSGRVVGLDVCDLRRKDIIARAPFDYVAADACSLPFPDESFDCVTLIVMLHHVANPRRVLGESYRVLQPSGRLIILEDLIDERWSPRSLFTIVHDSVVNLEFFGHPHSNRSLSGWHSLIISNFEVRTVELRLVVRRTLLGSLHYGVLRYEKPPSAGVQATERRLPYASKGPK